MAVIKLSGIVTEIRGKVGGSLFRKSNVASTLSNKPSMNMNRRGKTIPAGWNLKAQGWVAVASRKWRELTAGEREAWASAAVNFPFYNKAGEEYIGSGYQLFMQNSLDNAKVNLSAPTGAPVLPSLPAFRTINIDFYDNQEIKLSWNGTTWADWKLSIDMTRIMSKGRKAQESDFKMIQTFNGGTNHTNADLNTPWVNVFGQMPLSMNKAELIDAIASNAKLTKADAGRSVPVPQVFIEYAIL